MPGFQLKDGFGLDVAVTEGTGALSKYFKSIPHIALSGINLAGTGEADLSNPAIRSQTGDLTFSQPVDIDTGGVDLKVSAKAGGTLSIFVPERDGDSLFTPDLFGDNIRVPRSDRYVSMSLLASVAADVSISPGDLTFGFAGTSSVSLSYHQLFSNGSEKLLDAVEETISNFTIPANVDDIERMPAGSIATADGSGGLKFSGSANLLAVTNPLAAASLPIFGSLKITGGAAITVGAAFEFSGEYQVRVQKLTQKTFRLGFYRKRGSQFSVSADAQVSIAAKLADNDLFAGLLEAISPQPQADLKVLQDAGLSNDQIQGIQKAIKNAVDRSLAIGASLELSDAHVSDAMFLCEVDLGAIESDGRALVHQALHGMLSGIAADENLPRGIVLLKTLISKTRTLKHSLKVNLLGIYNFSQISSLIARGTVGWDRTTGELLVTDEVLASRIGISTSNLEADPRKLRRVLAQQFLITAAYSAAARMAGSGPQFSAIQSYFDRQADAKWTDVRTGVLLTASLGLWPKADALQKVPEKLNHFGPATIYAEAAYNNDAFYSIFFRDGSLRDPAEYISAGRQAITYLVQPGDPDEGRLLLATDDQLFEDLRRIGNPASAEFRDVLTNHNVRPETLPAVGADYLNVAFFTEALCSSGQALLEIERFLAANPNADPGNGDFKKLAANLSDRLAQLAERASEDFGGPWGFIAMALLHRSITQKWLLVSAHLTGALENPKPAVAAARR